jgi:hypothetical protein
MLAADNNRQKRVKLFVPRLAASNEHMCNANPSREALRRAVRPLAARSPAQARGGSCLRQGGEVRQTRALQRQSNQAACMGFRANPAITPSTAADRTAKPSAARVSSHVGRSVGEWCGCILAGACSQKVSAVPANPAIERTVTSRLCRLAPAAHSER